MPAKVKINTKLWDELRERLPDVENTKVRIGVLADKGGSDTVEGTSITMLELAAIHEFGSPAANIPERSFIRSTFNRDDVKRGVLSLARAGAKRLLTTGPIQEGALERELGRIGAYVVGQIKRTIKDRLTVGPDQQALRPKTIARKKSDLPLVDTGRLINAISWVVEKVTT